MVIDSLVQLGLSISSDVVYIHHCECRQHRWSLEDQAVPVDLYVYVHISMASLLIYVNVYINAK